MSNSMPSEPTARALAHLAQEAQQREYQALINVYMLQAQLEQVQHAFAAEKLRADDAEAKLPKADAPKP